MPQQQLPDEPQFIDDDHMAIVAFAQTYLGDDEEECNEFINSLMERRGYTRVESWGPPEPDPQQQRGGGRGGQAQGGGQQGGGRAPLLRQRQAGGGQRRGPYFGR